MDNKRKLYMQDLEDDLMILTENENNSDSKRAHYLSYTERYFKKYYKVNVRYEGNDHMVLVHTNKICVCTLAPSHPALDASRFKIDRIEFVQKVNEEMTGKHKHHAKLTTNQAPLCRLHVTQLDVNDGDVEKTKVFIIYSSLNAKLIEINEKLEKDPELLQKKSATEGYLAIMMTKLDSWKDQINELMNHEQYQEYIKSKSNK